MARVAGVNIPDKKQAWVSLTHIFGIGRTRALSICDQLGIEKTSLIGSFKRGRSRKTSKSCKWVSCRRRFKKRNKYQYKKTYGFRNFERNEAQEHLPVRGQRTKTND